MRVVQLLHYTSILVSLHLFCFLVSVVDQLPDLPMGSSRNKSYTALLLLVVAMVHLVVAAASDTCISTFILQGRRYTIVNNPFPPGSGVFCPDAHPNSVVFCNNGAVKVIGNFAAPNVGVCDPSINPYTLAPNANVTYEQYADQVIFRIPGVVPAAFRVLNVANKMVGVGLSGQLYGVSHFTDVGAAYC